MRPPNILFILIDDLGWKDLGCTGSDFYETPALDGLAAQGMRFTQAYAASPVCSPTRASILTGRYPARVGITDWIDPVGWMHPLRGRLIDAPYRKELPTSEFALPRALKEGGYRTWHIGKWHLGGEGYHPEDHGFDVNIGGSFQGSQGRGGYFSPWTIKGLENAPVPEGTDITDYLTDRAIDLIRKPSDRPFYLNLCHYCVHQPIEAKAVDIRKYEAKARHLGLDKVEAIEDGEPFPCMHNRDKPIRRRRIQSDPVYAAMIENLDRNIGRLLQALEETGQAGNTLVIFTSDNGGLATAEGSPTCNAPLAEGKGWLYEGGTREPLLVRWPGVVAAGSLCEVPVTSTDFYPTLLEAAGLPLRPGQHLDGLSLLTLLQGTTALEREAIFWHYPHYGNQGGRPGAAVRMGHDKLIERFENQQVELYDLARDPGESRDLSRECPERVRQMRQILHDWMQQVTARIPEPNPEWSEAEKS